MTRLYFDEAVPAVARIVRRVAGAEELHRGLLLRDAIGKITFITRTGKLKRETLEELVRKLESEACPYVETDGRSVASPEQMFDDSLNGEPTYQQPVEIEGQRIKVSVVDRRIVGSDWLNPPREGSKTSARLVFASLKGGVGRSTALCVLAAHLAARGKRVLVVDLDVEAPGIGQMLLKTETLPRFGVVDYLVEGSSGPLDDLFFSDMVSSSWLSQGKGRIDVVPAVGIESRRHPFNYVGKLARAYLQYPALHGDSFSAHIIELLERLESPGRYDVVLIDARAGLHETTATPLLDLDAQVFLFGSNQTQTFEGFRLLFGALALSSGSMGGALLDRFTVVQAKATASSSFTEFERTISEVFNEAFGVPEASTSDPSEFAGSFEVIWDASAPVAINDLRPEMVTVMDDNRYALFDPVRDPEILSESLYKAVFGEFIEAAIAALNLEFK